MSQTARVASAPSPEQQQQPTSVQKFDTKNQINVAEKKGWRKGLAFLGPGFLVCIAYIDPGNFQSDLQSGAEYKYELLWVILVASIAALIIQSLAANLGVVTGKHLAEHCRTEYPKAMRYTLWLFAEVAVIAADIPEVVGTAFALNILLSIPTWAGVLVTGLSTLVLLALQRYGVRKLEFVVAMLVMTMTACFFAELGYAKPSSKQVLKGLFVPQLRENGATRLAVSLLGALVMPHNLYLHSAIVLTRKVERTDRGIKDGCRFHAFESAFALFFAFLINMCVISVSGAVCSSPNLSSADKSKCEELDLSQASFLLSNVLGRFSKVLFGIALLASGQSSTITGTYAGQYVMQGFLNIRLKPWSRNLMTRSVAIVPSLIVALIGGNRAAGDLIVTCSMILSFVLPYVLIPMLKFTGSEVKMGPFANSWPITVISWIIGGLVMVINIYFLGSSFINWLLHSHLQLGAKVVVGAIVFSLIVAYVGGILYLSFRLDSQVTYSIHGSEKPPAVKEPAPAADLSMAELGYDKTSVPPEFRLEQQLHQRPSLPREDIAEMQLSRKSSSSI